MFVLRQLVAVLLFTLSTVSFAVPGLINYSGRLLDNGGDPVTAATSVVFSFYGTQSGGSPLHAYEYLATVTPNADGLYSVSIGDGAMGTGGPIPSGIFDAPAVWLNVNVGGEDLVPRARISSVGYAFHADESSTASVALEALGLQGSAYVLVDASGDSEENGQALLVAYERAKTLLPNDQPRSATNRATLIVPPGRYNLSTATLTLDTEFVDLIGLTTARENQWIYGASNGTGTGVLGQTANNVRVENLTIECTRDSGGLLWHSDPAAYYPDAEWTTHTVLKNCAFKSDEENAFSMRMGIACDGTYINCTGGHFAFGDYARGTFTDCTGGVFSFGGWKSEGTFTNCLGGDCSFGGLGGIASGTYINCVGTQYAFGGANGVADGTFINCKGGRGAFGGEAGTAIGTFTGCIGGDYAFGGDGYVNGTFTDCSGGDYAFGGVADVLGSPPPFEGVFTRCHGGYRAFGGSIHGSTFTGNPRFKYCEGGEQSFGFLLDTSRFLYCIRNGVAFP